MKALDMLKPKSDSEIRRMLEGTFNEFITAVEHTRFHDADFIWYKVKDTPGVKLTMEFVVQVMKEQREYLMKKLKELEDEKAESK